MTGMEIKRARGKCIAKLTRWFVSFAELSCMQVWRGAGQSCGRAVPGQRSAVHSSRRRRSEATAGCNVDVVTWVDAAVRRCRSRYERSLVALSMCR